MSQFRRCAQYSIDSQSKNKKFLETFTKIMNDAQSSHISLIIDSKAQPKQNFVDRLFQSSKKQGITE